MNTYDATAESRYGRVDWGIRAIMLGKEPGPLGFNERLLRFLNVIVLGLVAIEAAVAVWSIRRSRVGTGWSRSAASAAAVFMLTLTFAFGYVPSQVRSFLVGIALGRLSDISVMAVTLIALPVMWAIGMVLIRTRLHRTAPR